MSLASPAPAPPSQAAPARSEVIGLMALALCLHGLGMSAAWVLPDSPWEQSALSLLPIGIAFGLPAMFLWRFPYSAGFDHRMLGGGVKPWLLVVPAVVTLRWTAAACRPVTRWLGAIVGRQSLNDTGILGLSSSALIIADSIRTIILTPIAEEVFFRGFILGQLRKLMPTTYAVLVQASLFSLFHAGPTVRWERIVFAFMAGIVFGAWRVRFQGLLPLIVVHSLINAMGTLPTSIAEYRIVNLPECRQMEALEHEPPERAIPLIIEHLRKPDIDVGSCAQVILESRYRDTAGPYLREALASSDDRLVRATIPLARESTFPELVPEMRRLAWDHRSSDVQVCAVIQLTKLGDTSALAAIAADHPVPRVRRAASRLLADPAILTRPEGLAEPKAGSGPAPATPQPEADFVEEIEELSPEAAAEMAGRPGRLTLNRLSTLSPEAAAALAKHEGTLRLRGLPTLSVDVARALEEHADLLVLDGVTTLSPEAAGALARHKGPLLLHGLTAIPPEVAEALAKHVDLLGLNGLTALSPEVAAALAKSLCDLGLRGLSTLSDEVADALANHEGFLILDGVTNLSAEGAEALARHTNAVSLDGLTTLPPDLAAALAKHEGTLILNGLTMLSPESAELLATHDGPLNLSGLTTLSDEAAGALAKRKGALLLDGLETLSPEAAEALRANPRIRLPEKFR